LAKHDYGDRNVALDWTSQLLVLSSFDSGLSGRYNWFGLVWCGLVLTGPHRYAHNLIIAFLYTNTRFTSLAQSYVGSMEFEQRVILIIFQLIWSSRSY